MPYKKSELELGVTWLDELINLNVPLSQADLAEYFQKLPSIDEEKLDKRALRTNWLDSGWFAIPEEVREPNVSVSVILPEDVSACLNDSKEIINKSIPMNYSKRMEGWRELKGNLIAPPNTIEYGEIGKERGAKWL